MTNFLTNKPINKISSVSEEMGYRKEHPITGNPKQHKGIDLVPGSDLSVFAAHGGTINAVGYDAGGYGNYVVINSNDGSGKKNSLRPPQKF